MRKALESLGAVLRSANFLLIWAGLALWQVALVVLAGVATVLIFPVLAEHVASLIGLALLLVLARLRWGALLIRYEYTWKRRSGLAREKLRVEGFAGKPAPIVVSCLTQTESIAARRAVLALGLWLVLGMAWGGLAVHEVRGGWLPADLEQQKLSMDVRVVGLSEPGASAVRRLWRRWLLRRLGLMLFLNVYVCTGTTTRHS